MKKISALVVSAILAALVFAGCAQGSSGTFKVAVDNTYPPMEYVDENSDETIGFDVDVAAEIAKRLGKELELVPTAWDGIFQGLKTGKYDCIISSVSVTPDRLEEFSFTKPYVANAQMIIVKPDDNSVTNPEDLAGKIVGCQVSTTASASAEKLLKKIDFTLKTYDQVMLPFADMKAGRLDAIIVDEVVGQYYIAKDSSSYKAAAAKLTNEPIGICFKKENTALRDQVQKILDEMFADGTMKTLSEKWFGIDLVSNIDETYIEME